MPFMIDERIAWKFLCSMKRKFLLPACLIGTLLGITAILDYAIPSESHQCPICGWQQYPKPSDPMKDVSNAGCTQSLQSHDSRYLPIP
jgi:hypothetical protein